jgi:hypothetical protein
LQKAVEEAARQAVQHLAPASRPTGGGPEAATDIRKTVSEAVTSVLLETSLLDRLIERHLKSKAVAGAGEAAQANPKDPSKPGRDHAATPVQGDLRLLIQSEMKAFLTSQELKELLDEKFRSITLYLKNEVIPKAIGSHLQKA